MTTIETPPSAAGSGTAAADTAAALAADAAALVPGSASDARIAHLFRAARRQGKIHPLQHLIQRHRAGHQPPVPAPGSVPAAPAPGSAR